MTENSLKLVFQGNITISCEQAGEEFYNDLKIFLKSVDPQGTLNGQIMKMLEPCCKKRESKNVTT